MPTLSIEDYGIIGNYASSALVNHLGAIDWCCFPYLDSPSHFSAILDQGAGGKFQLCPQGDFRSEQRYLADSLILETLFETPFGRAVLTDWMPLGGNPEPEPVIYRKIEVIDGKIGWSLICDPRFDYGETPTEVEFHGGGAEEGARPQHSGIWSRKRLLFRGNLPGQIAQLFSSLDLAYSTFYSGKEVAEAKFTLSSGQSALFAWTWGRRISEPRSQSLTDTVEAWRQLGHRCHAGDTDDNASHPGHGTPANRGGEPGTHPGCLFGGPWHDTTVKTGLFLRLLIAPYAGSMAEAITTSLGPSAPSLGAQSATRDCRYAWIRHSALTVQALASLGMRDEANDYFNWLSQIVIRDGVELLQPVYTLDGGKPPLERELRHLKGFHGASPVRVGNEASSQFHLDIYGHVLLAADFHQQEWGALPDGLWPRLKEIADFVCGAWRRPDHGPWDSRAKPEHYVVSKALCWSTLDRACRIAERLGERTDSRWIEEMKILHRMICEQGFDPALGSFIRSFGDTSLDTSSLLLPLIGFLPLDDPRMSGTIDALMSQLSEGVLLRRHPAEPPHLWSSFLLIANLALSGRVDDASDRLAELCSFATRLGFFGEQVDVATHASTAIEETSGDFPSASAHLGLITAALYIGAARGRTLPIRHLLGRFPERLAHEKTARKIA